VWDESAQQVLDASQTLVAVVDGTIGSYPSNLYQINADLQAQMVAMPEFSIPTGTYSTAQYVSLSCQTTDALIRYTTNGTEPALTSSLYNEAITIATTTTLKAKAFLTGWTPSATASSVYTFGSANPDNPDTPVVTGIFDVYPNPFSYATTIQLGVKEANQPYCLKIYNIKGELVYRTEGVAIGSFELNWNGYSNDGKRLPTGIYLISFSAGNTTQARKTVLK